MPEYLLKSKKKNSKKPDRVDGKVLNSNKYIELRPTMEDYIKNLCETIMDIDEMIISENEKVDTFELIASVLDEAYDDFYNDLPDSLKEHAEEMFFALTEFVDNIEGYNTISESRVLDLAARRKKAMVIRRHKAKILTAKRRAARRRADSGTIERRANRKARLSLKKRFTGKKSYNALSPSEKLAVDKRMERIPKSVLQRLTTKMIPKVKQAETERLRKANKNNGDDKNKTTKSVAKQDVTKEITRKVGEIKQDIKKKIVKENIELMENMTDINAIFESEYVTKSELPKK